MIIKSAKKKMANSFKVKMPNKDGSEYTLEKTNYIKYLGVLIDDTISWKYHISFIRVDGKWASQIIFDLGKKKQKSRYFLGIFYRTF